MTDESLIENEAMEKADELISLLLQFQPNLLPEKSPLNGERLAREIAKLRLTLIEEFQKQPL